MNQDKSVHREAFEEFAEKAEEKLGDSLRQLYLYGSVARGEETDESDVDIFAVVENKEQKRWLQEKAARIGVEKGVAMSPIVRTEEEYGQVQNTSYEKKVSDEGEAYV